MSHIYRKDKFLDNLIIDNPDLSVSQIVAITNYSKQWVQERISALRKPEDRDIESNSKTMSEDEGLEEAALLVLEGMTPEQRRAYLNMVKQKFEIKNRYKNY